MMGPGPRCTGSTAPKPTAPVLMGLELKGPTPLGSEAPELTGPG